MNDKKYSSNPNDHEQIQKVRSIGEKKIDLITNGGGLPLIAKKTGRNEPCKCGSGLKSKNCHGNETKYFVKPVKKVVIPEGIDLTSIIDEAKQD